MANTIIFNHQFTNQSNLGQVPQNKPSKGILEDNHITMLNDSTKSCCCPTNCTRCLHLEETIKDLQAEIKRLKFRQVSPTYRFERSPKYIKSPFALKGRQNNENIDIKQDKVDKTKQPQQNTKPLKLNYGFDEHNLEKEEKMLLQIEQRAQKLTLIEKKQRDILKQIIQQRHQSPQTAVKNKSPQINKNSYTSARKQKNSSSEKKQSQVAPAISPFTKQINHSKSTLFEKKQEDSKVRFISAIQAEQKNELLKASVKKEEEPAKKQSQSSLKNIIEPEINLSNLSDKGKSFEDYKTGGFDQFKIPTVEPQQDIKSVSSLQKSTTSLLNEKEADVVYNNQIRSSKMLARIKRKK